jgi:vacuolar-type H+-ATPase subunit F/Vma7
MKLTKGKIVKLYSKNKQTKKRNKKERRERKTKTFRRRKTLDLSSRTLKRIPYGGADTNEMVPTNSEEQTSVLPTNNDEQIMNQVQENAPEDLQTNVDKETTEEEKPVVVETPNLQTNDVEEDESDNLALAQAFKTLAKYVASQIKNNMVFPIVNAAQTQAETEN